MGGKVKKQIKNLKKGGEGQPPDEGLRKSISEMFNNKVTTDEILAKLAFTEIQLEKTQQKAISMIQGIAAKDKEIQDLQSTGAARDAEILKLQGLLSAKDKEIRVLKAETKTLKRKK